MKFYLDTNIICAHIFGLDREPKRFSVIQALFKQINQGKIRAVVSFYTLHEFYHFCKQEISQKYFFEHVRQAFLKLFENKFELVPLIDRQQKEFYLNKINLSDPSDTNHVITALINRCKYLVTYDSHFKASDELIESIKPEELIRS